MPTNAIIQDFPRRKTGKLVSWIGRQRVLTLTALGVTIYFGVAIVVSIVEFAAQLAEHPLVVYSADAKGVASWWDILYFNLITILTVGYGDLQPASFGKALSVAEAFVGVGLFSVLVAVFTVKALMPPANTIVFSRHAFYCTEPERFLIVFVNTTTQRLGNVAISSYFKIGGDWPVRPHITAPLITQSVQTFHVDHVSQAQLIEALREGDCLRVGIDAKMDFSSFSASIQYSTDDILVIANRRKLVEFFEPRWDPDFTSPDFLKAFHDGCDADAPTLKASVEQARGSQSKILQGPGTLASLRGELDLRTAESNG